MKEDKSVIRIVVIIFIFVMLGIALAFIIPAFTGDGWIEGTVNHPDTIGNQITIDVINSYGYYKSTGIDAIVFNLGAKTYFVDNSGNLLPKDTSPSTNQRVRVYYHLKEQGEIYVSKIIVY